MKVLQNDFPGLYASPTYYFSEPDDTGYVTITIVDNVTGEKDTGKVPKVEADHAYNHMVENGHS